MNNPQQEDWMKEFDEILDHIFCNVQTPIGDFNNGKSKIKKHTSDFISQLILTKQAEARKYDKDIDFLMDIAREELLQEMLQYTHLGEDYINGVEEYADEIVEIRGDILKKDLKEAVTRVYDGE